MLAVGFIAPGRGRRFWRKLKNVKFGVLIVIENVQPSILVGLKIKAPIAQWIRALDSALIGLLMLLSLLTLIFCGDIVEKNFQLMYEVKIFSLFDFWRL